MNAVDHAARPSFNRSERTVVVVEDVVDLAEIMVMLLGAEGYAARYALSGKEGVALVTELKAHAVLLDHMLPDMTGAEVGIQLRAMPKMRTLKILMCTSVPEEVVRPLFDDYDAFLTKPVLQDTLVRALDATLSENP